MISGCDFLDGTTRNTVIFGGALNKEHDLVGTYIVCVSLASVRVTQTGERHLVRGGRGFVCTRWPRGIAYGSIWVDEHPFATYFDDPGF